jgi:hypothetical protein
MKLLTDGQRRLDARALETPTGPCDVFGPLVISLRTEPVTRWWTWFAAGTRLRLDGITGVDADIDIELLDEHGTELARAHRFGQRYRLEFTVSSGGLYYLRAGRRSQEEAIVAIRLVARSARRKQCAGA